MAKELERNGWPVSEADARSMAATLMRRAGGAQGLADFLNLQTNSKGSGA